MNKFLNPGMFFKMVQFGTVFTLVIFMEFYTCDAVKTAASIALEKKIFTLMEKWRLGDEISPGLTFPSLQALRMGTIDGKYRSTGSEIYYYLTDIAVYGLNRFIIEKLEADEQNDTLEAHVIIRIPYVYIYANRYMISGRVFYVIPISARGNVTVTFKNVKFYSAIQLDRYENLSGLRVGGCGFDFEFDDVMSDLVNDHSLNQIINSESVSIIERNRENIISAVRIKVTEYADEYLKSLTNSKRQKVLKNFENKI